LKKIGLVGGIAWLSTAEYYKGICLRSEQRLRSRERTGAPAMPELVIESLDLHRAVAYIGQDESAESWSRFDEYHRAALRRLEASGAQVAAIASFTAHHRLADIAQGIKIPVIDVFDIAARECWRAGARQALILGTAPTMNSARLRAVFAGYGVEAAGPKDKTSQKAVQRLIDELHRGNEFGVAGDRIDEIAARAVAAEKGVSPIICLACTELPLAFATQARALFRHLKRTYLNATAAHIHALLDCAEVS
jgi:aspartate racemase